MSISLRRVVRYELKDAFRFLAPTVRRRASRRDADVNLVKNVFYFTYSYDTIDGCKSNANVTAEIKPELIVGCAMSYSKLST